MGTPLAEPVARTPLFDYADSEMAGLNSGSMTMSVM